MQQALNVRVRLADGTTFATSVAAGENVLARIRAYGVPLKAECAKGGPGACSSCHVRIPLAWQSLLPAAGPAEIAKLATLADTDETSRLLCQIVMTEQLNGLDVELRPDSLQPQTYWVAG